MFLSALILTLQRGRTRVSAEGSANAAKADFLAGLQRGRTRVSAEGKMAKSTTPPPMTLQRGRTRVSAEGHHRLDLLTHQFLRFNGAALV